MSFQTEANACAPASRAWLFFLPLICLFMFASCLFIYSQRTRIVQDALVYIRMAEEMNNPSLPRKELIMERSRPPLLPTVMALGFKAGLSYETAGILCVSVLAMFLPAIVFGMAFLVFGSEKPALLAALLCAAHPLFLKVGSEILRDAPYWTFCALSIWLAMLGAEKRFSWKGVLFWALAALATCAATMSRKESIEIILSVFLWAGIDMFIHRAEGKKAFLWTLSYMAVYSALLSASFFFIRWLYLQASINWDPIDPTLYSILKHVVSFLCG